MAEYLMIVENWCETHCPQSFRIGHFVEAITAEDALMIFKVRTGFSSEPCYPNPRTKDWIKLVDIRAMVEPISVHTLGGTFDLIEIRNSLGFGVWFKTAGE